ncbi:hypothetical protein BCR33DRAFT_169103 [Rhizoclosmatium globosum]|uniref:Uncharacterized protein n=1 Tax=Rhizoclosmatium globosum TaxID=329046 RepID=A0A1Y2CEI5_9FUNG|nr:hypothetical protein BCR33DRAFT_377595 [Rhizoclosmatium globosum]ORY45480.1 hypothetical protein BCR33DRAFT_169103 [Rhizoclosmatium globosum]|eukprot:ORY39880.1 hypothetical protein BCR33DRAFT_377595 [Rhizoclosmatium globosum]
MTVSSVAKLEDGAFVAVSFVRAVILFLTLLRFVWMLDFISFGFGSDDSVSMT